MPQPKQSKATTQRPAAAQPTSAPARRPVAQAAPGDDEAAALRDEALRSNIAQLRDLLAGGVVLTAQRVQEAMDDAVARGRLTRDDAEQLVQGLVTTGRQQAFDLLAEVEGLVGRGSDKVRRAAKLPGGGFPIAGYDDLTAAAIAARLDDLDQADLRKIREYETRNANRKSVLAAVDKKLK